MARPMRALSQADIILSWLLDDLPIPAVAKLLRVDATTVRRWKKKGVPENREEYVTSKYGMQFARDQIYAAMTDAQNCTQDGLGGHPSVKIHENKDGSIDAQLTVFEIPRGQPVSDAVITLDMCCNALTNTLGTFIQIGMRWGGAKGKVPDSGDRRYRGLAEGSTFYYSIEAKGNAFLYAADMIDFVEKKRGRRKIESMFVRLHWNPQGVAPKVYNRGKPVYRAYKRKGES